MSKVVERLAEKWHKEICESDDDFEDEDISRWWINAIAREVQGMMPATARWLREQAREPTEET